MGAVGVPVEGPQDRGYFPPAGMVRTIHFLVATSYRVQAIK